MTMVVSSLMVFLGYGALHWGMQILELVLQYDRNLVRVLCAQETRHAHIGMVGVEADEQVVVAGKSLRGQGFQSAMQDALQALADRKRNTHADIDAWVAEQLGWNLARRVLGPKLDMHFWSPRMLRVAGQIAMPGAVATHHWSSRT